MHRLVERNNIITAIHFIAPKKSIITFRLTRAIKNLSLRVLPRGLRRQGTLQLTYALPTVRYAFNPKRYGLKTLHGPGAASASDRWRYISLRNAQTVQQPSVRMRVDRCGQYKLYSSAPPPSRSSESEGTSTQDGGECSDQP